MRQRAAKYGREDALGFGMRLQIVCADSEDEAWDEAHKLVAGATKFPRAVRSLGNFGCPRIVRSKLIRAWWVWGY